MVAAPRQAIGERPPAASAAVLSVVVVAGTKVRQVRLAALLDANGMFVRGAVKDADGALAAVLTHRPDALLLDLAPEAGGVEVVERLMARAPLPIVLTGASAQNPASALAAGAVDVVATSIETLGHSEYASALARSLAVASRVRVITHPRGRLRDRGLGGIAPPQGTVAALSEPPAPEGGNAAPASVIQRIPLVAVGASTGGPPALAAFLGALPVDFPAAVVVVQHMADGFVDSLASWLNEVVPMPVRVAQDGERLSAGMVVLAPSHRNLVIETGPRVRLNLPRPEQVHQPEVDTTFRSVAQSCGDRAVGVLLTGMGRDGAAGMRAMRDRGAFTIGQDEQTSAVWGMPSAAQALDGVSLELPLPAIAAAVVDAVGRLIVVRS